MKPSVARLSALLLLSLSSGCTSLEFRNLEVLEQGLDDETQSYRLQLRFELLDGDGLPVQDDDEPRFVVKEDGVPSTSESIRTVEQERVFRPVVLLLDTSLSMQGDLPGLRDAASTFVDRLAAQGFQDVRVYRFARTLGEVEDVRDLEAAFLATPAERWTALYDAVHQVLDRHPDSVLVVFSDGADNYSQNFEVGDLEQLTSRIEAGGHQVHAIGCGAVKAERDRNGVGGQRALRRIARNGTYRYVETVDGLDDVFEFIADRLQSIFTLEYFSPNLSGQHELVLKAKVGRAVGSSAPITFSADG